MTTVYSPAALLIIALSVLLVLVILLTVISFCVYVATGRSLFSFGKPASRENSELFALQEMWRQSYWWVNANWAVLNEMAQKGTLKSVVECRTEKAEDCLHWLRRPNDAKVEAFVTLQPQSRHFAATFAVVTENGLIELTGVEKAGYTLPLLERAVTGRTADDLKMLTATPVSYTHLTLTATLDAKRLSAVIDVKALQKEAESRLTTRLARLFRR